MSCCSTTTACACARVKEQFQDAVNAAAVERNRTSRMHCRRHAFICFTFFRRAPAVLSSFFHLLQPATKQRNPTLQNMHAKEALAFALICLLLAHEHNAEHAAQSAAMRVPKEHAIALMCSLWPCIHWIVSQRSAIACKTAAAFAEGAAAKQVIHRDGSTRWPLLQNVRICKRAHSIKPCAFGPLVG